MPSGCGVGERIPIKRGPWCHVFTELQHLKTQKPNVGVPQHHKGGTFLLVLLSQTSYFPGSCGPRNSRWQETRAQDCVSLKRFVLTENSQERIRGRIAARKSGHSPGVRNPSEHSRKDSAKNGCLQGWVDLLNSLGRSKSSVALNIFCLVIIRVQFCHLCLYRCPDTSLSLLVPQVCVCISCEHSTLIM